MDIATKCDICDHSGVFVGVIEGEGTATFVARTEKRLLGEMLDYLIAEEWPSSIIPIPVMPENPDTDWLKHEIEVWQDYQRQWGTGWILYGYEKLEPPEEP